MVIDNLQNILSAHISQCSLDVFIYDQCDVCLWTIVGRHTHICLSPSSSRHGRRACAHLAEILNGFGNKTT